MCLVDTFIAAFIKSRPAAPPQTSFEDFLIRLIEWKDAAPQFPSMQLRNAARTTFLDAIAALYDPGVALEKIPYAHWAGAAIALLHIAKEPLTLRSLDEVLILGGCRDDCNVFVPFLKKAAKELLANTQQQQQCLFTFREPLKQVNLSGCLRVSELQYTHSLKDFYHYVQAQEPVVIRGYARDWKAMDASLVRKILMANQDRWFPVEVGVHYIKEDWSIEVMQLKSVLEQLNTQNSKFYLAQYPLIYHIPELGEICPSPSLLVALEDFMTVKSCPFEGTLLDDSEHNVLNSGLSPIRNCWLGPSGKITPYHQDDYENVYIQVSGLKYFQLLNKVLQDQMCPFTKMMTNTSQISPEAFLPFSCQEDVCPTTRSRSFHNLKAAARHVVLSPGDCLYIPKNEWHLVVGLTPNFGISNWIS